MNHKGRSRHFTSAEELEEERKKKEQKKYVQFSVQELSIEVWVYLLIDFRLERGANAGSDSEEESSEEEESKSESGSGSEDESSSDDENKKKKGVSGLIEIENPNRVRRKAVDKVPEKVDAAGPSSKPELSRREREELEKQRATAKYQKMHSEGKTDEARADLARLAIIKQHRAEAQARREQDKKGSLRINVVSLSQPIIISSFFSEKDDKKKPGTK